MTARFRCSACGNLTRFDVVATRRTRAFHHFTVGGDLEIEDEVVLDERIEDVTCRWCGASGDAIESVSVEPESLEPESLEPVPVEPEPVESESLESVPERPVEADR